MDRSKAQWSTALSKEGDDFYESYRPFYHLHCMRIFCKSGPNLTQIS